MNPIVSGRYKKPAHRHRGPIRETVTAERIILLYACGHEVDVAARKRGRTVRNYGNRAELAVARDYGGRKVGHAQGPTDVVGTNTKTQVKTRRSDPPSMWVREFWKLDGEKDGRLPRLILRFIRPGRSPDDYVVVRGRDWLEWFGRDE